MKIKTLPHWILFFRLLSKDYDCTGRTFKDIFSELFIYKTDIYNKFIKSLSNLKLGPMTKINFSQMEKATEKFVTTFELKNIDDKRIVINVKTKEEYVVPKSSDPLKVITALGYSKIFI